jgi:DNA-binding Lrp family transcriptional regulator
MEIKMINEAENLILTQLRKNARMSLRDISKNTNVPVSTVFDKLRKLQEEIILKHTTLYDFAKLGCPLRVDYVIRVGEKKRDEVKQLLLHSASVNSIFRTNNGNDFYVEAIFRDLKGITDFDEELNRVGAKAQMFHIIEELKREEFFTNAAEIV